jgi:hypothetical protein
LFLNILFSFSSLEATAVAGTGYSSLFCKQQSSTEAVVLFVVAWVTGRARREVFYFEAPSPAEIT